MSRSYRKHAMRKCGTYGYRSTKQGKRHSNKKIRSRLKDPETCVSNGRDYTRLGLDCWDLWEYKSWYTEKEIIKGWYIQQTEIENGVRTRYSKWLTKYTLEEAIANWKKCYKCK